MTKAETERLPVDLQAAYRESLEWSDDRRAKWWRDRERSHVRFALLLAAVPLIAVVILLLAKT